MSLIDDLRQGGAPGDPMPIAFDPESRQDHTHEY